MKKSFGQHLLTNSFYLNKIIDSINLTPDDVVLEIGAGTGILTCELAKRVKKIFAVELENNIALKLRNNLTQNKIKNVQIIKASILKIDIDELIDKPFRVIGNIPYNITSDILLKLFGEIDKPREHLKKIKSIHLMIQKEVALRLVAETGTKNYSPLSILVQYFSKPSILFHVPSKAFLPSPKVDSAFIELKVRENLKKIENPKLVKNIIRTAFQQRRKKISNSLCKFLDSKEQVNKIISKLNINENLRPENLTLDQYILISNELKQ
ncbi:MAG: ribosomal RNA small subunit methyltransferase A [Candidatus Melainabacteria bacterium RIFCSPHIGHO2_02_FULL_34_12]|nr:MAG: ribosomal RNA small subunit methyltransferase A [Candidatus Melainabacteria bacterium RIFCSPHIGHO2_02_FULL_34_12]